jgi:glycosyltransferase involved in cell wall biosynthesis
MKIAQVVCVFPPYKGGIGQVAFDYAKAIQESGNEVVVFTAKKKTHIPQYSFPVKGKKTFLKYGNAAFLPQLFFSLLFGKFDIVHLHYPFFGTMEIVFLLKKIFRKNFKLIVHYHMKVTGLPWYLEFMRLPSRIIDKSLFRTAEKITCASIDYVKHNNQKIFLENKNKFVEIPFGIDVNIYKPANYKEKQILFVGGMDKAHYFKGVKILLKAFSQLNTDYRLLLVGSGDLMEQYKKYANHLNISKKVSFLGGVDNSTLIKLYQKSSCLVLPSINNCEAFGLVLIEAMACGTPVIATNLPGVRKVFENEKEGFYVKPNSVNELKNKINFLLKNDKKRIIMGKNARKLAKSKYNFKIVNKKLLENYKEIL